MTLLKNKSIATFFDKIHTTNKSIFKAPYIASKIGKKCQFKMCCFIKPLNPFALNLHSIFSQKILALEPCQTASLVFCFYKISEHFTKQRPVTHSTFFFCNHKVFVFWVNFIYERLTDILDLILLVDLGCIK